MLYTLAVEGGATHTNAGLYDDTGVLMREIEGGPANPVAYGIHACARTTATLAHDVLGDIAPSRVQVCAAFAGAADRGIQQDMVAAIGARLRPRRVLVTSDLHATLHANADTGPGILVIAGTGAAVLARDADGRLVRTGGWGALLGDDGSAYAIGVAALRAAVRAVDCVAGETALVTRLPEAAGLTTVEDFVPWSATASKRDIAALTPTVATLAEAGDIVARSCVEEEARRLAALALAAQERLKLDATARVFEYGGLLEKCALFRDAFRAAMHCYTETQHLPCTLQGHRAVYALAELERAPTWTSLWRDDQTQQTTAMPPTEQANVQLFLDELPPERLVAAMHQADRDAVGAVGEVLDTIALAVKRAGDCLSAGGRIIYAGAGTSGRLGALDAAECPPTFGVAPERVVAVLAGGDRALRDSVEGAEDDSNQGADAIRALHVCPNDFVVGIAASGGTPFVAGALEAAHTAGATTALVTSNPAASTPADIRITPDTGPEPLPGSTRLKAGTAAKVILNMISTGAMAQAGFVYKGRMIGMTPVNNKLRDRAARIVAEVAGISEDQAATLLRAADYHIARAILMAARRVDAETASALLDAHGDRLRDALNADTTAEPPGKEYG